MPEGVAKHTKTLEERRQHQLLRYQLMALLDGLATLRKGLEEKVAPGVDEANPPKMDANEALRHITGELKSKYQIEGINSLSGFFNTLKSTAAQLEITKKGEPSTHKHVGLYQSIASANNITSLLEDQKIINQMQEFLNYEHEDGRDVYYKKLAQTDAAVEAMKGVKDFMIPTPGGQPEPEFIANTRHKDPAAETLTTRVNSLGKLPDGKDFELTKQDAKAIKEFLAEGRGYISSDNFHIYAEDVPGKRNSLKVYTLSEDGTKIYKFKKDAKVRYQNAMSEILQLVKQNKEARAIARELRKKGDTVTVTESRKLGVLPLIAIESTRLTNDVADDFSAILKASNMGNDDVHVEIEGMDIKGEPQTFSVETLPSGEAEYGVEAEPFNPVGQVATMGVMEPPESDWDKFKKILDSREYTDEEKEDIEKKYNEIMNPKVDDAAPGADEEPKPEDEKSDEEKDKEKELKDFKKWLDDVYPEFKEEHEKASQAGLNIAREDEDDKQKPRELTEEDFLDDDDKLDVGVAAAAAEEDAQQGGEPSGDFDDTQSIASSEGGSIVFDMGSELGDSELGSEYGDADDLSQDDLYEPSEADSDASSALTSENIAALEEQQSGPATTPTSTEDFDPDAKKMPPPLKDYPSSQREQAIQDIAEQVAEEEEQADQALVQNVKFKAEVLKSMEGLLTVLKENNPTLYNDLQPGMVPTSKDIPPAVSYNFGPGAAGSLPELIVVANTLCDLGHVSLRADNKTVGIELTVVQTDEVNFSDKITINIPPMTNDRNSTKLPNDQLKHVIQNELSGYLGSSRVGKEEAVLIGEGISEEDTPEDILNKINSNKARLLALANEADQALSDVTPLIEILYQTDNTKTKVLYTDGQMYQGFELVYSDDKSNIADIKATLEADVGMIPGSKVIEDAQLLKVVVPQGQLKLLASAIEAKDVINAIKVDTALPIESAGNGLSAILTLRDGYDEPDRAAILQKLKELYQANDGITVEYNEYTQQITIRADAGESLVEALNNLSNSEMVQQAKGYKGLMEKAMDALPYLFKTERNENILYECTPLLVHSDTEVKFRVTAKDMGMGGVSHSLDIKDIPDEDRQYFENTFGGFVIKYNQGQAENLLDAMYRRKDLKEKIDNYDSVNDPALLNYASDMRGGWEAVKKFQGNNYENLKTYVSAVLEAKKFYYDALEDFYPEKDSRNYDELYLLLDAVNLAMQKADSQEAEDNLLSVLIADDFVTSGSSITGIERKLSEAYVEELDLKIEEHGDSLGDALQGELDNRSVYSSGSSADPDLSDDHGPGREAGDYSGVLTQYKSEHPDEFVNYEAFAVSLSEIDPTVKISYDEDAHTCYIEHGQLEDTAVDQLRKTLSSEENVSVGTPMQALDQSHDNSKKITSIVFSNEMENVDKINQYFSEKAEAISNQEPSSGKDRSPSPRQ